MNKTSSFPQSQNFPHFSLYDYTGQPRHLGTSQFVPRICCALVEWVGVWGFVAILIYHPAPDNLFSLHHAPLRRRWPMETLSSFSMLGQLRRAPSSPLSDEAAELLTAIERTARLQGHMAVAAVSIFLSFFLVLTEIPSSFISVLPFRPTSSPI